MRVLYIEGVAIRGGPESCGGVREGVCEALTGVVRAGLLSREIFSLGCRRSCNCAEGNIAGGVMRESLVDPARSGNLGTYRDLHAREPGGPMIARLGWLGRAVRGRRWP
jgi:hypothetical protein